jgi:DNA repair protein RadA/Sms
MAKARTVLTCSECGQQVGRWVGRCPGCDGWGTIQETRGPAAAGRAGAITATLGSAPDDDRRISTGSVGVDRVLGGGLVPASVALLAGEPGIGKSTLLLQIVAHLSGSGYP